MLYAYQVYAFFDTIDSNSAFVLSNVEIVTRVRKYQNLEYHDLSEVLSILQ